MVWHLGALQIQEKTVPPRAIYWPLNNTEAKGTNPSPVEHLHITLIGPPYLWLCICRFNNCEPYSTIVCIYWKKAMYKWACAVTVQIHVGQGSAVIYSGNNDLPRSMPFTCSPKSLVPTISFSDFDTQIQYVPCWKASQSEVSDKQSHPLSPEPTGILQTADPSLFTLPCLVFPRENPIKALT